MIATLSTQAIENYPLAAFGENVFPMLSISIIVGFIGVFLSGILIIFNRNKLLRNVAGIAVGAILALGSAVVRNDVIWAKLFDAPAAIVGEVAGVSIAPGGWFEPAATNVTFKDGSRQAFEGRQDLKAGDIVTVRDLDGKPHYAVSVEGQKPRYFE